MTLRWSSSPPFRVLSLRTVNRLPRTAVLLAATAALAHCSDSSGPSPSPVAIVVSPDSISVHVDQVLQMRVLGLDATGDTLSVDSVSWTSSDTTILTVSAGGLVTAHHYGVAHIAAQVDNLTDSARLRVLVPVVVVGVTQPRLELVPGGTLFLTATVHGAGGSILSDRDLQWNHRTAAISVTAEGAIKALQVGEDTVTATSEGVTSFPAYVRVTRPAFVRVATSEEASTTCALTADSTAYCWGANANGELGVGTYGDSIGHGYVTIHAPPGIAYPTGVPDFPGVKDIVTNDGMTCAVTGAVYCWGVNDEGSLGVYWWLVPSRATPGIVPRLSSIKSVVAGSEWACGLGVDSIAYCWGGNAIGFLLLPPGPISTRKYTALAGGYSGLCGLGTDSLAYCHQGLVSASLKFTKLAVGRNHECGIATDSAAYCWGQNDQGQLGDTARHLTPGPVTGGLKFVDIATGNRFTCGVVAGTGDAYCWGANEKGVLGQVGPSSNVPLRIPGNVAFSQITTGELHACALSVAGKVYCWGGNASGQLGDGTSTDRPTPALVTGQAP